MKLLVLAKDNNNLNKIKAQYPTDQLLSVSSVDGAIAALRSSYYDSVVVSGATEAEVKVIEQFGVPTVYFGMDFQYQSPPPQYSSGKSETAIALRSLQKQRDIVELAKKIAVLEHQAGVREDRVCDLEKRLDQIDIDLYGDAKVSGIADDVRLLKHNVEEKKAVISKREDSLEQWKLWAAGALISLITAGIALVPSLFVGSVADDRSIPSSVRQNTK